MAHSSQVPKHNELLVGSAPDAEQPCYLFLIPETATRAACGHLGASWPSAHVEKGQTPDQKAVRAAGTASSGAWSNPREYVCRSANGRTQGAAKGEHKDLSFQRQHFLCNKILGLYFQFSFT